MATKIKIPKRFIHGKIKRRGITAGGGGIPSIAPTAIAGLRISVEPEGLGALADDDPIATWADESGLGNDFAQGTGANQPLNKVDILNGFPIARFDGTDDFMASAHSPADASDDEVTYAVVFRTTRTNGTEQMILWAGEGAGNGWGGESEMHMGVKAFGVDNVLNASMGGAVFPAGVHPQAAFTDTASFHVLMGIYRNLTGADKTGRLFLDGVFGAPVTATITNNYGLYQATMHLGRPGAATRFFSGDIAAVAVFARALADAEALGLHKFWVDKFSL